MGNRPGQSGGQKFAILKILSKRDGSKFPALRIMPRMSRPVASKDAKAYSTGLKALGRPSLHAWCAKMQLSERVRACSVFEETPDKDIPRPTGICKMILLAFICRLGTSLR